MRHIGQVVSILDWKQGDHEFSVHNSIYYV